jgi:hypothetical protein
MNKARNSRLLNTLTGNCHIDNTTMHDDSWNDRFHIEKLPDYISPHNKYLRPVSGCRPTSKSLNRPPTAGAKSSGSISIVKNLSKSTVSSRKATGFSEESLNQLKEELETLWQRHQIPSSHRRAFMSKVSVIPLYSSIPMVMKEIDNLTLGKSAIQNAVQAVIKREEILHKLKELAATIPTDEANFQHRIVENLTELRNYSIKIVECVMKWRESMNNYHLIFDWENEDYFERMKRDVEFIPCSDIGKIVSLPSNFSTFVVTSDKHFGLPRPRSRSLQDRKMMIPINSELMTRIRLAQTVLSNSVSTGTSSTNTTFRSNISSSTRRTANDKPLAPLSLMKKRKGSHNKRKIIKIEEPTAHLPPLVSEKSMEESIEMLPIEIVKEFSEYLTSKLIDQELACTVPSMILESYNEMISASLVLFSSSILDKYITEVLNTEIPEVANEAYVEVIDCEYVDFQHQILIEVMHEELCTVAEVCAVNIIANKVTERFIHNIDVQDSVLESLEEENQQNEKLIIMIYTEILAEMVDQEWLEILAEDELSDLRMERNWEVLTPYLKKELLKSNGPKIHARLYEKVYFDILNDIVATTWLTGIVNEALGNSMDLDEIMPIPKTEESNTVKKVKYPVSMFRYT